MKMETMFFDAPARILRGEGGLGDAIKDVARQPSQEDAFYVLNVGDVVLKIKNWKVFLPRVKPFYAVKCNDNQTVLRILSALGTGFDCASKAEMKKVLDLGVSPHRIVYAHPCKPASHLRAAASLGVARMTFDNETELWKVKDIMPHAELIIRIRCDALTAQCPLGEKFGVAPHLAPPLLETAKTLGLNVVGVSFHVGSGCGEPQVFLRAIKAAREVFDVASSLGFEPRLLDIGGGFPGTSGTSLKEVAGYINLALEEHFPDPRVEVIAEPGRYVVASAFTLVTQVVAKRRVDGDGGVGAPSFMYYINDGVYSSFNCILYDHQDVFPQVLDLKPRIPSETDCSSLDPSSPTNPGGGGCPPPPLFSCSIWGPTCDSLDQVVPQTQLPELQVGDWIQWRDMGAYTLCAAGTFNGFPVAPVHVVVPFHTWIWLEEALASALMLQHSVTDGVSKGGVSPSSPAPPILHHGGGQLSTPTFASHMTEDNENNGIDLLNSCFTRFNVAEV